MIGINRNKAWGKHTKHQYSGIENTQSVGYKSWYTIANHPIGQCIFITFHEVFQMFNYKICNEGIKTHTGYQTESSCCFKTANLKLSGIYTVYFLQLFDFINSALFLMVISS